MEITLKAGDSLNIPEGCKAVIKDNVVVFEKLFQNGDVLHAINGDDILIFNAYEDVGFSSHYNSNGRGNYLWAIDEFRHATEEEKQTLFDKMKEKGLQWNADDNRVEKIRWRAKGKEIYYYVASNIEVYKFSPSQSEDEEDDFKSYNYFRTKEQAEEAARRMKEALFQYHDEIGE